MVKSPAKTEVRFTIGGKDIMYDGQGVVTLGNVLQLFAGTDTFLLTEIQMVVKGIRQSDCYTLARVFYKERRLHLPQDGQLPVLRRYHCLRGRQNRGKGKP